MVFPKSSRTLKQMFKDAAPPDIAHLGGEYLVDMLTLWPSFRRFAHRKVIYREDTGVAGYNVLFNKIWGRFTIEEGTGTDTGSLQVAIINYNRADNSFVTRGIRDHIRCVKQGTVYIGRFHYQFAGRPRFLGYFSLEKIMQGGPSSAAAGP